MQSDPHGVNPLGTMKGSVAFVVLLIHGWGMMLQAWTRWPGTCGPSYFGPQAVVGWVVAGCFPLLFPHEQGIAAYYYFCMATLLLFAIHSIRSFRLRRKGRQMHSHGMGVPWLLYWFPSLSLKTAYNLEALLQFVTGFCLLPVSGNLGRFWLIGMFASAISQILIQERDRRRIELMEDAMLEQKFQASEFQHYTRRERM